MRLDVVDRPDHAVRVEFVDIGGGEMHGDERGIGPVEHPRRQAVVLRNREPVPEGIALHDAAVGVFLEIPQQVPLKIGKLPAQPDQGRFKAVAGVRKPPEGEARPETPQILVPRVGKEFALQLLPRADYQGFHATGSSLCPGIPTGLVPINI